MRAVVCARVSSDKQRDDHTIESQLRILPEFCKRMGWPVVDTYTDDGESAKSGNLDARTDFRRLLADAPRDRFDVVVVMDIDRITRAEDLVERGLILGTFQRANVKIASPSGQILDLTTATGDLMASMQAFAAADWLRKHRERVTNGKLTAIARGRKPSGITPYGLRYVRATHTWSVDDETGPIRREIVLRVAAGESCYAVAADFERRGVPRARGGRWTTSRVWALVHSTSSVGRWVADKRRALVVEVPRIVSDDEHAAAIAALGRNKKRGLIKVKHVYLLQRVRDPAVCGRCGAPIGIASGVAAYRRGDGRMSSPVPSRYVCSRRRAPIAGDRCGLPYHLTAEVDAALWDEIVDLVASPTLVERAMRRRRERAADAPDPRADLQRARAEAARIDRAEAAVLERHGRGLVSDAGLDGQLGKLKTARAAAAATVADAERAIAGARVALAATEGLEATLAALRARVAAATPVERQALLRQLVGAATVDDTVLTATLHLPSALCSVSAAGYSGGQRGTVAAGVLRLVLPCARAVEPDLEQMAAIAAAVAQADVEPRAYRRPARVTERGVFGPRGDRLELRRCPECTLTYWCEARWAGRFCTRSCALTVRHRSRRGAA